MARAVDSIAQFPKHDAEITSWFSSKGWPVSARFIDDDRDVFVWKHTGKSSAQHRTLRISLEVLDDTPANDLVAYIEVSDVASTLSKFPEKYVALMRSKGGDVSVAVLDRAPS